LFAGPSDLIVKWSIRSICFVFYQSACLVHYQICLFGGQSDLLVW